MTPPRTPASPEALHERAYLVAVLDSLAAASDEAGEPRPGHVGHAARALRAAGLLPASTDAGARKALDRYLLSVDVAARASGTTTARGYLRAIHPRSEGQPAKARG